MKTNNSDNYSDDRVVDILSPRFAPSTNLEFKVTAPAPRRRFIWQFARVGGIAAVVAIALFVGIKGVQTSTAREVVERAMTQLLESDNCLVRFTANVTENKSSRELYDVDFDGTKHQPLIDITPSGVGKYINPEGYNKVYDTFMDYAEHGTVSLVDKVGNHIVDLTSAGIKELTYKDLLLNLNPAFANEAIAVAQ
jgi:hypothetical protein